MAPKLILADLDGTLLDESKRLTPRSRAALERAAASGAQVVIATGRFFGGVPDFLRELPFLRYFILMNGAKVYDRETDTVLYRAEIPTETLLAVCRLLEPLDCTVDCYQNDRGLMPRRYYDRAEYFLPDPISRLVVLPNRTPVDDLPAAVTAGGPWVQKIQCFFPHLELRPQVMALLKERFPQLIQSISLPANLELNAPGATKGDALEALCRHLGLDLVESAAFGDGTNDLTMLQRAGVGVAMANADPQTLQCADLIAPSNREDGVAQILEQWFPETVQSAPRGYGGKL